MKYSKKILYRFQSVTYLTDCETSNLAREMYDAQLFTQTQVHSELLAKNFLAEQPNKYTQSDLEYEPRTSESISIDKIHPYNICNTKLRSENTRVSSKMRLI